MQRCTKCVIPETHETISFDHCGVCNVCRHIEYKDEKIDWIQRAGEFEALINQYRGKGQYDCIVPFSGGKDSTYTLYAIIRQFNLKPLVISFDHGFYRPTLLANVERTLRHLGCDYLKFRANIKIVKKLMVEALIRKGDFCWHCHTGIFAYPMQIAVKFKIPLIIWGEPSAEYTAYYDYEESEEVDEKRFNRFINLGINAEDMVGMLDGSVTMRDLEPFRYPPIKELRAINFRSVCLGTYYPWDVKKQVEVIRKEIGWQGEQVEGVPEGITYEKIECAFQGIRDYCKIVKRGYARVSHLSSIDIRKGCMTREEAFELIRKYEGKRPKSLDVFLKYLDMTEEELNEILVKHQISPYRHNFSTTETGVPLPDMADWHLID